MNTLYRFVIGLAIIVNCLQGISQTNISGNVNIYAKVVSVHSTDSITVDNSTGFKDADTVMIVQMKGADFDLSKNNNIVNINGTGRYELIIIQHISGTHIKFLSNLINTYDATEALQLVRIPYYQYASVSADLTCQSWDGDKGGVIAIIIGDTLELNANIEGSSKGFSGGNKTSGGTTCYQFKDSLNYQESASDRAGLKGGGIGNKSYPYTRGRGAIGNAGGGGNGFGAGGGGGSGYGGGGNGGRASSAFCMVNDTLGGYGGKIPTDYYAGTTSDKRDRIFMGGGGGSSIGQNNDALNGGAGGGIIFIITNHLKTNNYYIRSNGENLTTTATNQAGAGGGGGGGSILLCLEKLTGQLNVEAKGGRGGNADHCSGQGGGGGGGFIWFSGKSLNFGSLLFGGGPSGLSTSGGPCSPSLALNGSSGDSTNRLNPVLNGFLFNLIGKSQTICYGDAPQRIVGTIPRGGNGTYTFQWQKRVNTGLPWTTITDSVGKDYSSPALYTTAYFRRIVKSKKIVSPFNDIIDSSKSITINVIPQITNNSIAPDTAICYGQNPIKIKGLTPSGGDGTVTQLWEESLDNSVWINASGSNNLIDYANTSNQESKYYRRKALSNICVVTSNTVFIIVYPLISNNSIQQPQTICYNSIPKPLIGNTPTGGANSYRYQWLKNITDSLHWIPISSGDTLQQYSPSSLTNTIFYRRVVLSGLRNTCKDTTSMLKILVLPKIGQNQIQQDQTICGGTSPETFTGSFPTGGDNVYRYQWENSANDFSWDSITTGASLKDYKHGILDSTRYFRRIVRSGYLDCCKDTSARVKITVQPKIQNNTVVSNQEICNAQTPAQLVQVSSNLTGGNGPFTFLWQQRPINASLWAAITEFGDQVTYQPTSLGITTYYRRKAMSGVCINFSDSVTITVLPSLTGNTLAGNNEVCDGKVPDLIAGGNLSGGQQGVYRYVWQDSILNGVWNNISNASDKDYLPNILEQNSYFRRIVKSGLNDCCISTSSPFGISINPLPIGLFECHDTAICGGSNVNAKLTITSGNEPFETKLTEGTYQETIPALVPGLNNISFIPQKTGTYSIFSITDSKGCLAVNTSGSGKVRVVDVPKAVAGESALVEGKTHNLAAIPSIGAGKWLSALPSTFQPSDTTPTATVTVENYGVYHFIWQETNEFCSDTASVEIIFWMRYTGFSPNNDGVNDYFVIEGLNNVRKELIVVNRWGNEVYSSDDYKNNWDGTNQKGKPLPDDTYFYILKIPGNRIYKGFIVIRR